MADIRHFYVEISRDELNNAVRDWFGKKFNVMLTDKDSIEYHGRPVNDSLIRIDRVTIKRD